MLRLQRAPPLLTPLPASTLLLQDQLLLGELLLVTESRLPFLLFYVRPMAEGEYSLLAFNPRDPQQPAETELLLLSAVFFEEFLLLLPTQQTTIHMLPLGELKALFLRVFGRDLG